MTCPSTAQTTLGRVAAKTYVQACFSKAGASAGTGYVAIKATTVDGTVWLGSAGSEDQAWQEAANRLDQDGCGHYAVPSWDRLTTILRERNQT